MRTGAGLKASRKAALRLGVLALLIVGSCFADGLSDISAASTADAQNLYSQSVTALLDRSFPSTGAEYILLDLRTRRTVAVRWPDVEQPIPVGSLLKPFVALAYAGMEHPPEVSIVTGEASFPVVHCHGKADGCWHARGHGALTLEHALAQSCNAYFLALARDVSKAGMNEMTRISDAFGLARPPALATPQTLIGVTPEWRVTPLALVNAYATLASQPQDPVVSRLLRGMRLATSAEGTAARVGVHTGSVLAKTGTAPCRAGPDSQPGSPAACVASGDGLVVVLAPAEAPQLLLLVRERGTTGAQTAAVAGRMLGLLEAAHAGPR